MDRSDGELIRDFGAGDQAAFGELVRRHVDLVYAAALRHVRDPGAADDVTQAVFLVLAKKGRRLGRQRTVAGWLIVVTRYVARAANRARTRRVRHERAAAKAEVIPMHNSDLRHQDLSEVLDEALSRLSASDRDAIALRYLQARSFVEVGTVLGISEEAARKRVARGIERLRDVLRARGVGGDGAAMSAALAAFAAPAAPAGTVARVCASSIAAPPAVVSLSQGALRMFAMKEFAVVCVLVVVFFSAAAAITVLAQENHALPPAAGATPVQAVVPLPRPIRLDLNVVALQLAVSDVEANIEFFKKMGFGVRFTDKPDANGKLIRATVDSGSIRIRLYRDEAVARPGRNFIPYFWIDGGAHALAALQGQIVSRGIAAGPVSKSIQLMQFEVVTPDGYTIGFYSDQ